MNSFPAREWLKQQRTIFQYELEGDIYIAISRLQAEARSVAGASLKFGHYDDGEIIISGYVRKTPEEIAAFDARRAKAKISQRKSVASRKEKTRLAEIEQLKKLAKKHPDVNKTVK